MNKGFTLVEVIVTSLLMSIVLLGTTMVIRLGMDMSNDIYAQASVDNDIGMIRSALMSDIRQSSKVFVSNSGKDLLIKKNINGVLTDQFKYSVIKNSDNKRQLCRAVMVSGNWGNWQILNKRSDVFLPELDNPFHDTDSEGDVVLNASIYVKADAEPKEYSAVLKTYVACRNR